MLSRKVKLFENIDLMFQLMLLCLPLFLSQMIMEAGLLYSYNQLQSRDSHTLIIVNNSTHYDSPITHSPHSYMYMIIN